MISYFSLISRNIHIVLFLVSLPVYPAGRNPLLSLDSSSLLSHPLSEHPPKSRQPHYNIPPIEQLPRSSAVAGARSTAPSPRRSLLRKVSFGANQTGDPSNDAEAAANGSPGASYPLVRIHTKGVLWIELHDLGCYYCYSSICCTDGP